jgi:HAD superfamily hydrolase (TIGR01484 family)
LNNPGMPTITLACDYDETLASHGQVARPVLKALARFKASGGKLILVTGRELEDLAKVGPDLSLFDFVVVENGAVAYHPESGEAEALASPPSQPFVARLRERGVKPLSVGRSIVATVQRYAPLVRQTIEEMGLALEIVPNRSSLMVLPRGVNKGTGLNLALQELGLPMENVIGVGDAENDAPFLGMCGTAVAVANAIPSIKAAADWVTDQPRGEGVIEVINRVMSGDLYATRITPSR